MARQRANSKGKVAGILGALGAAATAWYFLDPKNGKYRRKKFAKGAKKAYNEAEYQVRRISEEAAKGITTAVDKPGELARQGMEKVTDVSHTAVEGAKKLSEKASEKAKTAKTKIGR